MLGKPGSWGWGNSVRSSPPLLEEELIDMLEEWSEGESQTEGAKHPRIEGEARIEGNARDWAGEEFVEEAG